MHEMNKVARPLVVKAGGNAMDPAAETALAQEIAALTREGRDIVLVHGGGPEIDAELDRLKIRTERIGGLRATPAAALAVTERVLCGSVNKRLVRALLAAGVRAAGLSGIDGAMLQAQAVDRERLGFVGRVTGVDTTALRALLDAGYVPVVAPLGFDTQTGGALNINADTSAAAIAGALHAQDFVLLTNVTRVRGNETDPSSGLDRLSLEEAKAFAQSPACSGSMLPKMQAAIDAVAAGVARSLIGASSIARILQGDATVITA